MTTLARLAFGLLLASASCALAEHPRTKAGAPTVAPDRLPPSTGATSPGRVSGELIVIFTQEASRAMEQARNAGGSAVRTGFESLDQLLIRYGVTALERVFPAAQDPAAVQARFPARTQRIPPGSTLPDLSRAYLVRFSPDADLTDVLAAFARDPNVASAQPNYRMSIQQEPAEEPAKGGAP